MNLKILEIAQKVALILEDVDYIQAGAAISIAQELISERHMTEQNAEISEMQKSLRLARISE